MKKKRVFTAEQKMEVLREAEQNGYLIIINDIGLLSDFRNGSINRYSIDP
ncbi:hypothetical protein ACFLT1_09180 [Bacteroidota bacterium]